MSKAEKKKSKAEKKKLDAEQMQISAQAKRFETYKVGNKDMNGNTISWIYAKGDEFLIYEFESKDPSDSIRVLIDTKTDEDKTGIAKRYNKVSAKFSEARTAIFKATDKKNVKEQIARILATALMPQSELEKVDSNKQFEDLIKLINSDYKEQFLNRMRYLVSSFVFASLFILLAIASYQFKLFQKQIHIHDLIYVCAGGCVGGLFSLAIGVNKLVCEREVSNWLYFLYGVERIIISILAATIVYFAIISGLIFGICYEMKNPVSGFIVFAIAGGFSESLVPNLLKNLEKTKTD